MKKILSLALVAIVTLTANANRKWDFTTWSATTVANLMAGAGQVSPASNWSDIEKSTGTAPTDISKESCFWEVTSQGDATNGAVLQANGQNISEFDGLLYTNTASRSLAIAVNYPTTSLGTYHGASYLWLGSSKKNYFVIQNVKPGATIKIGLESHKPAEARGVNLYVVAKGAYNTLGTQLKDADGNAPAAPTTYEEQEWVVPEEGLTDTPNEDGTFDVMIYNTNGCHLYFIEVQEGSDVEEDKNVAWISTDHANDMYKQLAPSNGVVYTDVTATDKTVTADYLRSFDAVVVSTDVAADSYVGQLLADNIAYVPMVNLNTNLFGYTPADVANNSLTAVNKDDEFFAGIDMDENGTFEYIPIGVALPERFASDDILAKNGDAVAIHQHASKRNSYILIPSDAGYDAAQKDAWTTLVANAISTVAATKKTVTQVAAPVISLAYADGVTTVSISCSTSGSVIQYCIGDGEYQTYTEPFQLTTPETVYAIASAEGYLPITDEDGRVEKAVDIQTQVAAPSISVLQEEGQSSITLSCPTDGASVYYSFSGQEAADHATLYTEPITVKEPGTITAIATAEGKLTSAAVAQAFQVAGIPAVKDTLSHFTANETDWFTNAQVTYYNDEGTLVENQAIADAITAGIGSGSAKAIYYFGKSAWKYYSDEVDHTETVYDADGVTPLKGADGNDSIKTVYKTNPNALKIVSSTSNTDWVIKSQGQAITGETNQGPVAGVSNGTAGRYADAAIDEIGNKPTTGFIDFGGKTSGEPYTMRFESTKQFSGDMDVVAYLGNGGTSDIYIALQKSEDGNAWTTVDTLNYSTSQRFYKKSRIHMSEAAPVYLRVAQLGGGSKGYIYDIYVIRTEGTTQPGDTRKKGDINGDGKVDQTDIEIVVNTICGLLNSYNADLNGNGTVDVCDLNIVIDAVINQ